MNKKLYVSVAAAALLATIGTPVANVATNVGSQTVSAASVAEQNAFIAQIAPFARTEAMNYGVYPSIMMAQAITESGWGQSQLARAPYYNLFGLKFKVGVDEGKYGRVNLPTQEWNGSRYVNAVLPFRTYTNFGGSFADNGRKLRYGPGAGNLPADYYKGTWLENTDSYVDSANYLTGKYATDPGYGAKLINIIKKYNLTRFDPQMTRVGKMLNVTKNTVIYNTFSNANEQVGNIYPGQKFVVSRQVKLPSGALMNEIGKSQWVRADAMDNINGEASKPDTPVEKPDKPTDKPAVDLKITNAKGVVKVTYKDSQIAVWAHPSTKTTGQYVNYNTRWKFDATAQYRDMTWYRVGANQWLPGVYLEVEGANNTETKPTEKPEVKPDTNKETPASGVATVNYVPGYFVFLADANGDITNQKVGHGTKWKVFAKKTIGENEYYRLGSQTQWIPAQYLEF